MVACRRHPASPWDTCYATVTTMLSIDQKAQYAKDGYIAIDAFKSADQIAALKQRALEIVDAFDANQSRSIFTTENQLEAIDDYFLASGNNISCFFEESAFDAQGQLRQPKALSINKIGHAMHDLDPAFERFSRDRRIAELVADLDVDRPQIWQSMYIFKQPRIGGEVNWHQDASFFYTEPLSVITLWFALEDATVNNGCLWVEPGGHRSPLRERFVVRERTPNFTCLSEVAWPEQSQAIPLEIAAGGLVCFHGLLPHYSAANRSNRSRHAYTLHITDAACVYSDANWLQRPAAFPVRGFD